MIFSSLIVSVIRRSCAYDELKAEHLTAAIVYTTILYRMCRIHVAIALIIYEIKSAVAVREDNESYHTDHPASRAVLVPRCIVGAAKEFACFQK